MSKLKFLTKWNEQNEYKKPYSPTNEINDTEIEEHVPSDEPSLPVSITFDVEQLLFKMMTLMRKIFFLQERHHLFHLMHKVNIITILFAKIFFQLRSVRG